MGVSTRFRLIESYQTDGVKREECRRVMLQRRRVYASQALSSHRNDVARYRRKRQLIRARFTKSYKLRCRFIFCVILRRFFECNRRAARGIESISKSNRYVENVKEYVLARKPLNAEADETSGDGKKIDPTTWRDGTRRRKTQGWEEKGRKEEDDAG